MSETKIVPMTTDLIERLREAYKLVRGLAGQLIVRELPDGNWLPAAQAIDHAIRTLTSHEARIAELETLVGRLSTQLEAARYEARAAIAKAEGK